MEETIDIIERMESGNYEYDQMEAFEAWVKRHHGDKKEKEINNIKAQMANYESGPKYLHDYVSGEAALRNRILRLGEETKQGTEGGVDKVQSLQVTASTEQFALASNDHAFNFSACFGHAQCFDACCIHFWAECIPVFRIAQGENKGSAFAGAKQLSRHDSVLGVE